MKIATWKPIVWSAAIVVVVGALSWWRLSTVSNLGAASTDAQAPTSVRAARATLSSIQSWVFAEGTARSVRREYLTFENPGRVTFVKDGPDGEDLREGTAVSAGEILARQDDRSIAANIESEEAAAEEASTQIAVSEAELVRARTEHELARKTLERFAALLEQDSASKQEYDEANASASLAAAAVSQAESRLAASRSKLTSALARVKQARLALEETELRSPIDGVVAYVNIKEGYYFTPTQVRTDDESAALQTIPMVIIDPTAFEITVNVPSFSRGRLLPGQEAIVAVDAGAIARLGLTAPPHGSGDVVRGEVFSVNPAVSPGGRAVQVKVRVVQGAEALEDGLFVNVWLAAERRTDVVVVPVDAILHENNAPFVFVIRDGVVARRSVALGLQEFTNQEVTTGLADGDLVVTDGRFKVSDGTHVRVLAGDGR